MQQHTQDKNSLVDAQECLRAIFSEGSRPSIRWFREQQRRRVIPHYKIGRLCRFDVAEVRQALAKNLRVEVRA